MKKIKAELSVESIQKAIDSLKGYQNNVELAYMRAIEQIVEDATQICQEAFGNSVTVDHSGDISEKTNVYRYEITAEGKAVGFLEFGAGAGVEADHPFAKNAPFPVYSGSYSEANNGMYAQTKVQYGIGWWVFGGKIYLLVEAKRGLYKASENIRDNARRIIAESVKGAKF